MKRACVIGWPVAHSRSPAVHTYWLKHYGLEGDYTKEAVPPEEIDGVPRKPRRARLCRRECDAAAQGCGVGRRG